MWSITRSLHDVITVAIDFSTTSLSFHSRESAQDDGHSKLENPHK